MHASTRVGRQVRQTPTKITTHENKRYSTTPPTRGLKLFNLYVALSQSSGRSTIRLLWDFNDGLFQAAHEGKLLAEDDRHEELNGKTCQYQLDMVESLR